MATRTIGWRRMVPEAPPPVPPAAGDPGVSVEPGLLDGPRPATFIHPDCEVEGKLVITGSIRIDGEFRGSIESPQTVTVGESAAVEGSIQARSVIVEGAVVGDVRGSREVVMHATGRLRGSVETPSLVIERGAVLNGQTRMYRPEERARARPPVEVDARDAVQGATG